MPLFDYECGKCGQKEEVFIRLSDSNTHLCSVCNCVMEKKIPYVRINMGPAGSHGFYDETMGKYIGTNTEWRRECELRGITPRGETPKLRGAIADKTTKTFEEAL
jgi:putative FmdB family regulatory protein